MKIIKETLNVKENTVKEMKQMSEKELLCWLLDNPDVSRCVSGDNIEFSIHTYCNTMVRITVSDYKTAKFNF